MALIVKLYKPTGGDSGHYNGIGKDFQFGEPTNAVWMCKREEGVMVLGSDFIKLGGSPDAFIHKDKYYTWGSFKVVSDE